MDPITRKEKYLSAIANVGEGVELPNPVTREEFFLKAIYDSLSGGGGTTGGTTDYNDLSNKPRINGVELSGNLSFEDLGIVNGNEVAY